MSLASVFSLLCATPRCRVPSRLARAATFVAVVLASGTARAQTPGSLDSSFNSAAVDTTIFAVAIEYNGKDVTETEAVGGDIDTFTVLDGTGIFYGDFANPLFGGEGRTVYTIVPEVLPGTAPEQLLVGGIFGKNRGR